MLFRSNVAADLVQTRIVVLGDAWDLLKFLFAGDEFAIDPAAAAKNLGADAAPVLDATIEAVAADEAFTTARAFVDGLRYHRAATLEFLAQALQVGQAGLVAEAKRTLLVGARAIPGAR